MKDRKIVSVLIVTVLILILIYCYMLNKFYKTALKLEQDSNINTIQEQK